MEKVYNLYNLVFEWSEVKSFQNLEKHGVDFEAAIQIWTHDRLEIDNIARTKDGEERSATIGIINKRIYVAIWTKRNNRIRIISVRKARHGEKEIYQNKTV